MRISDWSSDVCSSDLLVIASEPSAFCTSQAQPEPKVPTAVSVNCFLKSSTPPNCLTKASVNFLPGAPCFGVRQFQKKLWFQTRSEEHTSELQSLMRISYAVFCLKKKICKQNTYVTIATVTPHIYLNFNTLEKLNTNKLIVK